MAVSLPDACSCALGSCLDSIHPLNVQPLLLTTPSFPVFSSSPPNAISAPIVATATVAENETLTLDSDIWLRPFDGSTCHATTHTVRERTVIHTPVKAIAPNESWS